LQEVQARPSRALPDDVVAEARNVAPEAEARPRAVTTDGLLARLAELGIAVRTAEHRPVFTVKEARRSADERLSK
jgi:hypothetical protein